MLELPTLSKDKLNKAEILKALTDPETFATVLHAICLLAYGEEIYSMDSTELYLRLKDDYGAWPCDECESKLQAILLATSTDDFYEDLPAFRFITHSLVGGDPQFESMEELSLPEIYWAVWEVELNHGEEELSEEIKRMVAKSVGEEADDYVGLEEMRPNHVVQALSEYRQQLSKQLKAVGFKGFDLPQVN